MRITTESIFIGCFVLIVAIFLLWILLAFTVWVNKIKERRLNQLEKQVTIGLARSFKGPRKSKHFWISSYFSNNEALWQFSSVLIKVLGLLHKAKAEAVSSFSHRIGLSNVIEKKLRSNDWYTKAMAIRLSYELGLFQNLEKINLISNDSHILVLREKQIALVSFLGWKSLIALSSSEKPISHWQQLCILDRLHKHHPVVQKKYLKKALEKNNPNATDLLIRIIRSFKLSEDKYFIENQLLSNDKKIRVFTPKILPSFETNSFETWLELCQTKKISLPKSKNKPLSLQS